MSELLGQIIGLLNQDPPAFILGSCLAIFAALVLLGAVPFMRNVIVRLVLGIPLLHFGLDLTGTLPLIANAIGLEPNPLVAA